MNGRRSVAQAGMHAVVVLFAWAGLAAAQVTPPAPPPPLSPPRLVLPPGETPVELVRMEVHVTVSGLESETETTLTFRNPNGRQLAGDLELPLPDGAVVAGYALDIGGRMVDGVGVTKEKARVVLETEMRRRVDPGLVEHVRGNLFRTRIFPLPAHGERTVRVVSVAPLALAGGDAACQVPLPRVAIPTLVLRVEVLRGAVRPELGGFGNLTLTEWKDRWVAETTLRDTTPGADLRIRLPQLPELLTTVEELGGERYLAISHAPTAHAAAAAAPVTRAAIAWDASGSRAADAVQRDRALLAALLATPSWRSATLDLVVFRDRPEPPRTFTVRNGAAPELLAALDALAYDGGTDLAALDLRRAGAPNPGDAAWLLFTDGLTTLGQGLPALGGLPVHVVASDTVRDAALQRFVAAASGGVVVDLATTAPEAAARLLAEPPPTLLRVEAPPGTLDDVQYRLLPGAGRATVYARLLRAGEVALVYGAGGRETARVAVHVSPAEAHPGRLVARAWAGRRVEELAVFPEANEAEMAELGRRFGLVTPVTSLLVLETAQQYLQHGIEPPESWPEMRQQYFAGQAARKGVEDQQRSAKIDRVLAWWEERVAWWEREYQIPKDLSRGDDEAESRQRREGDLAAAEEPLGPAEIPEPSPAPAAGAPALRVAANADMRAEQGVVGGVEGGVVGGVSGGVAGGTIGGVASKQSAPAAPVAAAIAIQAWSPDTPYLAALRGLPAERAYAAYLQERARWAGSPAFFLDAAGVLLPLDRRLGLRVLSNLAEMKLDDAALLRVFAWRLGEAGELDRAIETLEKVRRLRPEDPQSHRDLALLLGDRMDRDRRAADGVRAARLLYDVVLGEWSRFEQIEVIALMELNRLLARLERLDAPAARGITFVDPRLRRLIDLDVRIVMSWDADNTDIDLHVVEPSGEEAYYGHNLTTIGGHVSRDFTQGYGPEEYVLRRAMPGVYRIRCKYYGSSQQTLVGPATVTATVITNFGRPGERRQTLTLRLEQVRDMVDVGEVTIGAGDLVGAVDRPAGDVAGGGNDLAASRPVALSTVEALRQGTARSEVERRLGPPLRVEGSGLAILVYATTAGTEVRLDFGPGLLRAREDLPGGVRLLELQP